MSSRQNILAQSGYGRRLRAIACLVILLALPTFQLRAEDDKESAKADTSATSKISRKLVKKIDPVYPQDLKRRSIGGTVKLDVKITAGGSVEKVAIVGGNPILADSAARAVKQWQYAPASASSSMLLNVEFNPNR